MNGRNVMKAVIQRVLEASVTINHKITGSIDKGLLVFLGVGSEDTIEEVKKLANKMIGLRIFEDQDGKTNLSLQEVNGQLLVVSQFTLLADCKKGRRPSFIKAGDPNVANDLYEDFISLVKEQVDIVEHGEFGADMKVSLINDGPFTIILDTKEL